MNNYIFFTLYLLLVLLIYASISIYIISLIYSSLKGCFFVPSNNNNLERIFTEIDFKNKKKFIDLGSGDGRVVHFVAKKYKIMAIGLEINPILIIYSKFIAKILKLNNTFFLRLNIVENKIPEADVFYLFLLPKLIDKIKKKLLNKLNKGSLIISHGFTIPGFESCLIKKINTKPFPTYFYKN